MKRLVAALMIAGVSAFIVAGLAPAKTLPTPIRIDYTLPNGSGGYKVGGKLTVKRPCRLGRTVSLNVLHADGSTTVVNTQKLTKSGVGLFTLNGTLAPGESFVVTVAPLNLTLKSGARFHCAAGTSAPIHPTA